MTLQEAINSKKLPNLSIDDYKKVFSKIGIDLKDFNYELTTGLIVSLQSNTTLHKLNSRKNMLNWHSKLTSNYDNAIAKYESLLNKIDQNTSLSDKKEEIEKIIRELNDSKNEYEELGKNLDLSNLDREIFSMADQIKTDIITSSFNKQENKIEGLSSKIAGLQAQSYNSNYLIKKNNKKIRVLYNKLEKLRKKQGALKLSQKQIIDAKMAKYVAKRQKEFAKLKRKQMKEEQFINKSNEISNNILSDNKDLNTIKQNQEQLKDMTGLKAMANKFGYKMDELYIRRSIRKNERKQRVMNFVSKVKNITPKNIFCTLKNQYSKDILRTHTKAF